VKGAGADLHVVGLENDAALLCPVRLKPQDQILKVHDFPFLTREIGSANYNGTLSQSALRLTGTPVDSKQRE